MTDYPPVERLNCDDGQKMVKTIKGYIDYARESLAAAQEKQREQANRHRREPDFDVGSCVRIIKKTYSRTTDTPTDKLDFPLTTNAYKIIQKSNHSYKLELPETWRGARVFHADRLRLHPMNPVPGQAMENPDGEDVRGAGKKEWEVEEVTASKISHRKLWYQVKWKGWDPDPAWYLAESFQNAPDKLKAYHDAHPDKAGPPMRLQQWLKAAEDEVFCDPHPDDNKAAPAGGTTRLRRTAARKARG